MTIQCLKRKSRPNSGTRPIATANARARNCALAGLGFAFLVKLAIPSTALADNTWDGGGGDNLWGTNANWGSNTAPGYGTLTFAGTTRTSNTDNSITAMNQLNWTGASAWTVGTTNGTTLSLFDNGGTQAKIENNTGGAGFLVTINLPITFAALNAGPPNPFGEINAVTGDITFADGGANGSGTLTVNGVSVNGIKLFGGGRVVTFNNTVSAAGKWFGITTGGTGNTINIGGSFTSSDFYVMNDGTLNLNSGGSLTTSVRLGGDFGNTGNQNQTKSGTFNLTATTGGQTFSGVVNSVTGNTSGTLSTNSQNTSGTNTLSGHIALDSALKITQAAGGTLNITQVKGGDNTTGTDIKAQTLTFTPGAGATINHSGTIYNSTGSGSLVLNGAGTVILSGNNTYGGTTTGSASGTLNINSATAIGTGALVVGGTYTIDNTSANDITLSNNNPLTLSGGSLTFTGTKNLSFGTGAVTISGANRTITVNGSTLTLGGVVNQDGSSRTLTKAGAGALTLSGSNVGGSAFTGGVNLSGGTLNINNANALGTGTFNISAGTPTIDNTSGGAITLATNNVITFASNLTFAGTNDLNVGTGAVTLSGANRTLTVNAGTMTIGGAIGDAGAGRGLTKLGSGTLILSNSNTYTGNTGVSAGTLSLQAASAVSAGTLSVTGTGTLSETATNAIGGTTALTLNGASAIANLSQSNNYSGVTTLSAGTLNLGNKGAFGNTTNVAWNGVTTTATTNLSGANAVANTGTLGQSGNIFSGTNNLELSGTLTNQVTTDTVTNNISIGTLTLSGTVNLSNSATARTLILNGSGNTNISGVIANGGGSVSNLTYSGSGILTLSGASANTYTGTTTINNGTLTAAAANALGGTGNVTINTGGTLLLSNTGTTDRINDSATITMAGGTIAFSGNVTEGSSPGTGALTLTANSIIDFANGNAHINFADSSSATWTASTVLSIYNWDGSYTGGGNDQVIFGSSSSALMTSQLAQVSFYSGNGTGFLGTAGILSNGELVPVPEPGAIFIGLGLLGLIGYRERRRRRA